MVRRGAQRLGGGESPFFSVWWAGGAQSLPVTRATPVKWTGHTSQVLPLSQSADVQVSAVCCLDRPASAPDTLPRLGLSPP